MWLHGEKGGVHPGLCRTALLKIRVGIEVVIGHRRCISVDEVESDVGGGRSRLIKGALAGCSITANLLAEADVMLSEELRVLEDVTFIEAVDLATDNTGGGCSIAGGAIESKDEGGIAMKDLTVSGAGGVINISKRFKAINRGFISVGSGTGIGTRTGDGHSVDLDLKGSSASSNWTRRASRSLVCSGSPGRGASSRPGGAGSNHSGRIRTLEVLGEGLKDLLSSVAVLESNNATFISGYTKEEFTIASVVDEDINLMGIIETTSSVEDEGTELEVINEEGEVIFKV